jgi:hypothetical protein
MGRRMGEPTSQPTPIRALARRALGTRYDDGARWTAEALHRARWLRSPMRRITRAYVAAYGLTVRDGPFAGLRYPRVDVANVTTLVPKLVGSYERELHAALERLLEPRPPLVVNAGCADGYYAVGLALRLPGAIVHALDLEPRWRWICGRLARVNEVPERVAIGERLDAAVLSRLPLEDALVVIDCDGCEDGLFEPETVIALKRAAVIVETHDTIVTGVTSRLRDRFAASHDIEVIEAEPRWISEFPELEQLTGVSYVDRELGITEFRPLQRWLVMTPRRP